MSHDLSVFAVLFAGLQDAVRDARALSGLDSVRLSGTMVMWFVVIFVSWAVWLSLRRSYTRPRS